MSTFAERVFRAVEQIPRGKVATYGEIALLSGSPRAARAVGNVLHHNPHPIETPCHRVVNGKGRLAPAFAFGGMEVQRQLLEQEGITFLPNGRVDLSKHLWKL